MNTLESAIERMNVLGASSTPFFFVISYDREHHLIVPQGGEGATRAVAFSLPSGSLDMIGSFPDLPDSPYFVPHPILFEDYATSFSMVRARLLRGDSYLLNLCVETAVDTNLECAHFYRFAEAPYRMILSADESGDGVHDRECVCFSPEPFITISGREIATYPMKGTAEDTPSSRCWLESDQKENRESATIVDLMRNDLSQVASDVHVRRYRYISPVKRSNGNILQCSSEIVGTLPQDWKQRVGDILMTLLPAGSVTGAPKQATCQAIKDAETMERGYYTGVFGYFDGEGLESAVAIRFMEKTPVGMVYKSGGGITVMSDAEQEYQEILDKVYVPFDF